MASFPGPPPGGPPMPGLGGPPGMGAGPPGLMGAPAPQFPTTTPEGWGPFLAPITQAAMGDQGAMQQQQAESLAMALIRSLGNMGNPAGEAAMTTPASPLAMGGGPSDPNAPIPPVA